jgi:hypothetical protein
MKLLPRLSNPPSISQCCPLKLTMTFSGSYAVELGYSFYLVPSGM